MSFSCKSLFSSSVNCISLLISIFTNFFSLATFSAGFFWVLSSFLISKSGKYFVSLCCEIPDIQPIEKTGSIIGIDLGIKDFLIDSNGNKIENPHYYIKAQ